MMFLPGNIGREIVSISNPNIFDLELFKPVRSYDFVLSQFSRTTITSTLFWKRIALIPKIFLTSIMPIPLISIKCLTKEVPAPIKTLSAFLDIITISSATSLCPLSTRSNAISLFPIPDSPQINIPSPYTSTNEP